MSRLYFKFGWQIPGQIATLRSFLTMCHDKEDSLLPRRTRDSGSIFGGGGTGAESGTTARPPPFSHQPA